MLSKLTGFWNRLSPVNLRILFAVLWLPVISASHWWLNYDHGVQRLVKIGYMPVITNLAAPILDYTSQDSDEVRFKALKYASFAEMAESLRNDQIQVAFMIAPLSIVMRQQGEDVKVIMIGNRHESTLVARKELNIKSVGDLAGHTVAVPMRYSGHNLSIREVMEKHGLATEVNIVEMNPPDMAAALAAGVLDAYYVGEPFAAQTLYNGQSSLVTYVEDVWPHFMCNLVVVKKRFIDENPELVQAMVQAAVRSGVWASKHPDEVAKIASIYWNQPGPVVRYALTTPPDRIRYDLYTPKQEDFQRMAELMVRFKLSETPDFEGLIDDRFAKAVDVDGVTDIRSIVAVPR